MKALALDTSTLAASLALVDGPDVLAESNMPPTRTHSRILLPEIQRLLARVGLVIHDLDFIAVGLGPGSFTGLRIGLSAAKGLAWAAKKPLVGVPTLDALVRGLAPEDVIQACPLIDARKGQVYSALYRPDSEGRWDRRSEWGAYTAASLRDLIFEETVFFGEGARTWGRDLADLLGPLYTRGPEELDRPRAVHAAGEAFDLLARGVDTDPARVIPIYVRPPDIRKSSGRPGQAGKTAPS